MEKDSADFTLWDVVAGKALALSDARELLDEIDDNASLRAAAVLRGLDTVRTGLSSKKETAALDDTVELPVATVIVLARALLQRLK